eukprot:11489716-Alexandrium_andersonii.AAC.1
MEFITGALTSHARLSAGRSRAVWRSAFQSMSADTWGPARRILKPSELPMFSPEDMRSSWFPIWAPDSAPSAAHAWGEHADAVPSFPVSGAAEGTFHDLLSFRQALSTSSGSAGFDGWSGKELRFCPGLMP